MKLKPPFKINVPMVLTWLRIALIPVVLGVFYIPETWLAPHWVNVIACVTFVVAARRIPGQTLRRLGYPHGRIP